jgi:hypothetical protein
MEEPVRQTETALPRKPYTAPTVTRVPLVPEELLVASCAKTPNICHFHSALQQTKS